MKWEAVCEVSDIPQNAGVAALVSGKQIALFKLQKTLYAVDNFDPISQVNSLSRGIVGCIENHPFVASPLYKQRFSLATGQCLDHEDIRIGTYPLRCNDGIVEIGYSQLS